MTKELPSIQDAIAALSRKFDDLAGRVDAYENRLIEERRSIDLKISNIEKHITSV